MDIKKIKWVIMIFILVQLLLSVQIAYSNYFGSGFCITGDSGNTDCDAVQGSEYGRFLGVPLGVIGSAAFLILLVFGYLALYRDKDFGKIFGILVCLGTMASLYLLYIQFFVLKQICSSCLVVDGLMIGVFVLTAVYFLKNR